MPLTDNDMLLIYCCLGGGVFVAVTLLVVLYCRRLRKSSKPTSSAAYNTLREGDTSPEEDQRRKRSHMTQESGATSTTNGGGDLADYLQNLVDGMERGRTTQTSNTNNNNQRSSSHLPPPPRGGGGGVGGGEGSAKRSSTDPYRGGDASLLTIVPSDVSRLASTGATPFDEQHGSKARLSAYPSGVSAPPSSRQVFLGVEEPSELSSDKTSEILQWRQRVEQETCQAVVLDDPSRPYTMTPSSQDFVDER